MIKAILLGAAMMLLSLVVLTYAALELGDVLLVQTHDLDRNPRVTHIWFVESEEQLLLEAGNPNNPWVQDLDRAKSIRIIGHGLDGEYTFSVRDASRDHQRIRSLMRKKYGWRDWWVSTLFETSESALVALDAVVMPDDSQ